MSKLDYIAKNVQISTEMDEIEWDDATELAGTILEAKEQNIEESARFWCFVTAGNIDWRGSSGVALFEMYAGDEDDIDNFWQRISGINGDWTIRIEKVASFPKQIDCMVYSHDTPTGGFRRVRFLTSNELLTKVLKDSYKQLKEQFECKNRAELIMALENDATEEDIRDYL